MLEWDKLRTFYYVAKHQSITHAAREINITQSALSRQIMVLEAGLGFKLFQRHGSGLVLTKEGNILYQAVRKMMEALEVAVKSVNEAPAELEGPLKVDTTVSLTSSWLATNYLGEFTTRYPNINLILVGNDEVPPPDTAQINVSMRPYIPNRDDLIQEYLMSWHLKLYAHSSYLRNFGTPQDVSDLQHHRLLTYGEKTTKPYQDINWILTLAPNLKPYLSINASQGLLAAAEAGLGIAGFSQEFTLLRTSPKLLPVLPEVVGPVVDIYYIYPKAFSNFKRILVLRDFLKEVVARDHVAR